MVGSLYYRRFVVGRQKPPCLIGTMIGRLGIIDQYIKIDGKGNLKRTYFKCRCICGKIIEIVARTLISGRAISCGCYQKENLKLSRTHQKPFGEASFNDLFRAYKEGARTRNLNFQLTEEQFRVLTKGNCFHCGVEPKQEIGKIRNKYGILFCPNGNYIYNGIDRQDNKLGYILENCVSCCIICNRAKHSLSIEEFEEWKRRFVKHNVNIIEYNTT